MKCPKCNSEHEGDFCPKCNHLPALLQENASNKKLGKLLGFRTNTAWKKVLSILYLIFSLFYLISVIFAEKYVNITNYDFMISQICDFLIFVVMIFPYIFLSNTKFRDKLPLFKKHTKGASLAGLLIVTVIIGIVSGVLEEVHSKEFLADRENHAYKETLTEATCEKDGEIKKFCEYCGQTETEKINALGHKMVEISHKEATETEEGEIIEECSVCGKQQRTVLEQLKSDDNTSKADSNTSDISSKTESKIDITQYYGEYYSKSKLYGISLQENDEHSFYLKLSYSDGTTDEGNVIPGKKAILTNYSDITVTLNENGIVHVKLNSAITANGNFDEDLIKGNLIDIIGLTSASQLNNMDMIDMFPYLCQIENNCVNLSANSLIRHPDLYNNNTIYRIPGVVTWAESGKFLLQITDKLENNTIVCYSSLPVSEGDEICVYGNGIGKENYTRTYYGGTPSDYKFETLKFQVGFILYPEQDIPYDEIFPSNIQSFIDGEYTLKNSYSTPYNLESTLSVNSSTINNRFYSIDKATITFAYTPNFDNLNSLVSVHLVVSTQSKRNQEVTLSLLFDIDDEQECHCVLRKEKFIDNEYIFYTKIK